LPKAFRAYAARYPGVEFQLREMHSGAQLEALHAGSIDVGLLRGSHNDDDLEMETAVREPFIVLLPVRHPLASQSSVAPKQLAKEPFILFPRQVAPTLYDQILAVCRAGDFSPRIKHEALEWHTVTGLIGAGMGVAIAPAGIARLKWRGVVHRPLKPLTVETSILMCRRRESARGAVESFVEMVRQLTPFPQQRRRPKRR
jgi:DNA-binding transcriptional LysR family regulator